MTYGSVGERVHRSAGVRAGRAGPVVGGALVAVLVAAVVSCGPDSKSKSSPPVAVGAFAGAYADAWCRGLQPCCGASGFPFDLAQCKQSIGGVLDAFVTSTSTRPNRVFDETAAGACVEAQRQRLTSCTDKDAYDEGRDACDDLFRGTVALGGSCAENAECAPATGGVSCNAGVCEPYQDPFDRPTPTRNALGARCDSTCSADPYLSYCEYPDVPDPLAGCYEDDGLFCSKVTGVCEALPSLGEACPQGLCERDTYCEGTCRAATTTGPCGSRDECTHTSNCNVDVGLCEPRKANGEACNTLDDCLSASCVGDVCRDWSVATPARCAGGLDG